MSYPCTKCGLCCQNIGGIKELSSFHNGDGICVHYDSNYGCKVYETRPIVCRIDEGYEYFFQDKISFDEYYKGNQIACNQMQEKAGLDLIYRVKINGKY